MKDVSQIKIKKKKKTLAEIIFYCVIVIPPFIQVLIYYFGVNIDSVLLAFEWYDEETGFHLAEYWGMGTFVRLINEIFAAGSVGIWLRGVFLYAVGYVNTFVNLIICFFLYKKIPFSNFFKVVLFMPSILVGSAMVLFYKEFMELNFGSTIITGPATCFWMCWLYGLWLGFGGGVVMTCGMYARIDPELVESINLDGGNLWTEFVNLAWPKIYPIITIGIYTGLGGIFSSSPNTYLFFGNNAPEEMWTLGYVMYTKVVGKVGTDKYQGYCVSSAMNLFSGLVVLIPTFILKHLFEKYDPNN